MHIFSEICAQEVLNKVMYILFLSANCTFCCNAFFFLQENFTTWPDLENCEKTVEITTAHVW